MQNVPAPNGLQTVKSSNVKGRGAQIEAEALGDDFHRVITAESTMTDEEEAVCHQLVQALDLRWKWLFRPAKLPEHDVVRSNPHTLLVLPSSHHAAVLAVFEPGI